MNIALTMAYGLSIILLMVVGGLILLHNPKPYIKITLSFFLISVIGFLFCMYFGYYFSEINPRYSLWFIRGTFASAIILGHALIALAYYYPLVTFTVPRLARRAFVFLTSVIVITSFTNLIYEKEILTESGIEDLHGDLHGVYLALILFYLIISIVFFIKKILSVESIQRKKTQLVALGGISYALLLAIVYPILPRFGIYILQREAILFGGVLAILILYSMLKYRFLDVRFIITRIVKQGFALLFTMLFVSGVWGFIQLFSLSSRYQSILMPLMYIVAIFMYLYILRGLVSDIFHKFFGLTNVEHFRDTLENFTKQSTLYATIWEFDNALKNLFATVHIKEANIVPLNTKNQKKYRSFVQYFEKNTEMYVSQERPFLSKKKHNIPVEIFLIQGVCIPLFRSPGTLLGFFILGKKQFDDLYFLEEIKALEKFKRFLELRMVGILYSDYLQREVEKKTKSLKEKNKELKESNEKLQVLDEAKDTFLSIASHELRTPMTVIGGFADLLLSDASEKLSPKQKMFLTTILQNTNDLTELVNKMLDISSLEAGKMEFIWEEIYFSEIMESIMQEFEVLCREKNIQFEFKNLENANLIFRSDPQKLKQIMRNLLGNALKFTPENGKITIKLERCNLRNLCAKISVIDTGIGIPKRDQKIIFDKFHRTKHSAQTTYAGTGLGLHIVKLLVDALGGEIMVKSEKNKGACFIFIIPEHTK